MKGFFNIDGPFYKFGNILADIMILSVMWWILLIPIFTVGASTSALFYITTRRITDREGYLFRDFFRSFKTNFKVSTLTWLIIIFVGLILVTNIYNLPQLDLSPTLKMVLYPFQLLFALELILITLYVFVIIARFEMNVKAAFRTAVYMVHRHLLTTVMLIILLLGVLLAGDMYPLFYVIAPGCYAYVTSYLFIKIFKKYRPEIDENPYAEIDRQHEEQAKRLAEISMTPVAFPGIIPDRESETRQDSESQQDNNAQAE